MRCPWCGSPVMIRGSSWECGWCGDFGSLQRTPAKKSQNTAQITLTLSFVYHVDLPETWSDLKKALGQLAPKNILLSQLLGKVLLHNVSTGIQNVGALPDEKKAEELRTFLTTTTDLNLGENAEEIMCDAKRGVLFCEEAALSETDCGTFWTELLSTRPVEDYYNRVDPDGLFDLLSELSSAYAYFGGKKDEEMGEAQDYQNALEEAYNTHWQNKVLLHPDVERAKRLLAQGKFPDYEDICREVLLVEYPEEVPHETAEDFDELSWERVLDDVFADDPEKGMEMWRRLLDIAEPSLKTDAKTAEKLLPDWNWLEFPTDDQALPLLVALDDERFVSQLFENAYLDRLQFNVLEICRDCGEETLARHCMDLALKNPCLDEQWRKRYTQVLAAAPSSKRTKPPARALARPPVSTQKKPTGESYYQFCNVQFKEDGATYAYLTGGISLKAGDFVVVPIGDHQAEKLARVTEVFVCSTQNAPYPPEKAKFVLRKSERTAFPERTKLQHPAPKQAAAPAPTEKSAPTVQSAIMPPIVSQTPTEPEITEKKSRFIATVRPVETEEDALAFLEEMKKKYWDARHNCSAFVIGSKGELTRSSDDGEPSGTAGRPMLEVLTGSGIRNIAAVVTRYFGGVLLGTGGLVRAYSGAVKMALEQCETITRRYGVQMLIKTDYNGVGKIQYLLGSKDVVIQDSVYAADVQMTVLVPIEEYDRLCKELVEATNGRVGLEEVEKLYYDA